MEKRYLECNCSTPEHLVRFFWWLDDKAEHDHWSQCLIMETQLTPYMGFFSRLWHGIKYILGFGTIAWADTLMYAGEAKRLRDILDEFIKETEEVFPDTDSQ